jgi:uncharacterized protein YkwD
VVGTLIVLVLPSPLEDPLSAKRVISTKRRVQAFVLLAIAVFVAGGVVANRYVTAAHMSQPVAPATDAVVPPSPESSAVRPAVSTVPTTPAAPAPLPKAVAERPKAPKPHAARPKATSATSGPSVVTSKVATAENAAVRLTNTQRAKHGCAPLRLDSRLRTAARRHSADMRLKHYFEHNSPDGTTPWDRIKAAGYSQPGAENIAAGYATAQAVVQGWMNSPGHRANIVNCSLKAVGIGVEYGQGGPWWTQDFGFQ